MRFVLVLACALACSACMQETVRFKAKPTQQAIVRDGRPALISRKPNSIVMIRPAARRFQGGSRPVFVVGLHNLTRAPLDFSVGGISVIQHGAAEPTPMKVFSYEDLVDEEKTRQIVAALLVGAAAGANTALAARAGYRTHTTTVRSPGGSYTYRTTSYNPSAGMAAHRRATRQNQRLIDAAIGEGQANLAALEREVIKDNTLMPGEWYGGTLHVQAPHGEPATAPKTYSIAMTVGPDRHVIDVVQENAK